MGDQTIPFLVFYVVLVGLLVWFEGELGITFLTNSVDVTTASDSLTWWNGFLHVWSEYTLLNLIIFAPLLVVGIYLIVQIIVDLIP